MSQFLIIARDHAWFPSPDLYCFSSVIILGWLFDLFIFFRLLSALFRSNLHC